MGNISKKELDFMKKQAKEYFAQSDAQIDMQVAKGMNYEMGLLGLLDGFSGVFNLDTNDFAM
jgi:hypothetical protein